MNTSKSIRLAIAATLLSTSILSAQTAEVSNKPAAPEPVRVFVIDDQTGEELATKHGIQPLAEGDMEAFINAVIDGTTPVQLFHEAVDEDSRDNTVTELNFKPYTGGKAPQVPPLSLPLGQLTKAMQQYRAARTKWQQEIRGYRAELTAHVEGFTKGVIETQRQVSERFDRILAARHGRDFNRSDIQACILTANQMLGTSGKRFLVLNTDAQDLPSKRTARTWPLLPKELDPQIELIFVNTSRIPDRKAPMFQGVKNPVHHADSVKAAMELICKALGDSCGTVAPQ